MNISLRFWLVIGAPPASVASLMTSYVPAVLQYNDNGLKCTYVAKGSNSSEVLFDLSWNKLAGYYYNGGGRIADSISVFTSDNKQYTFNRNIKNTNKDFPEVLISLTPDDTEHKAIGIKPTKEVVEVESVLANHNVPVYKLSLWKRLSR